MIGPKNLLVVDEVLDAENDYYFQKTSRYNVNLNYRYEGTKDRVFNIDADYGLFKKNNSNLQSNIYSDGRNNRLSENLYRSFTGIDINLKALKFDYSARLWSGTFEGGAKVSHIRSDNNARFFHVLKMQDSLDDRRTNLFGFQEQITSGYLSYKKGWGKWVLQGGLRLENSSSEGLLLFKESGKDSLKKTPVDYTNLFPSFSISYKASDAQNISLAYSRRIDRPAYQDLNPFIYLLDELSFWQGNPYLQPQLTHRATLQYVFKSSTIVGINFAHTEQYSTRITDTLEAIKIVMIPRNLGVQKNLSVSLTQNYAPAKWWDITLNGNIYQIHNRIQFDKFRNLELKQLASRLNLQQRFKMPYQFTGELTAFYTTRRLSGANEISRSISQVDIGIQKVFLNNKAIVRFVFNDVYRGNKARSVQQFDGFYMSNYGYYESRQVRLNFTYKFSDTNVKGPRNRTSALENENGRIK